MNLEELKNEIAKQTGVPAALLKGETLEENIARAKALLAFRREKYGIPEEPKSTAQLFAEWMQGGDPDPVQLGKYPQVTDGGEITETGQKKTTMEVFSEWAAGKL